MSQPQDVARSQFQISTSGHLYSNATPFPNYLLNEVMPTLRDTEWKLLCVIVRQTLGWHDAKSGGRKSQDWMTRSQLMQKTGRNSEALSQALDSLVQGNLIEVKSASGKPLPTTALRRQTRGRIFYALHPLLIQQISGNERTKSNGQAVDNCTKSEHETSKIELTSSVFRHDGRKSEHRKVDKPNRTKETLTKITKTKENGTKKIFPQSDVFEELEEALHSLFDEERVWDNQSIQQLPLSMQRFIEFYSLQYARYFSNSNVPTTFSSALKRLNGVLAKHSQTELADLLDRFFICELPNVKRQWYSLEAFVHNIEILKPTEKDS